MQSRRDNEVLQKMTETRVVCVRETSIEQSRIDASKTTFHNFLQSITASTHQTLQYQERLGKLKAELREKEDALVKALAAKTRKEAKRMAMVDSLSIARNRIEELKGMVEDNRARKDEYAKIINEQLKDLLAREEKYNQNVADREEIEDAISWYNRVLGFRIECGRGVKFIFTNINLKNIDEEYSFTIRHENEHYSLLHCDPNLNDTKEMVDELNRSNGLFKFVRTMREKFQDVAMRGIYPQVTYHDQGTITISESAPFSTDSERESLATHNEFQLDETNGQTKKPNHGKEGRQGILSPRSALSLRRSPRRPRIQVENKYNITRILRRPRTWRPDVCQERWWRNLAGSRWKASI